MGTYLSVLLSQSSNSCSVRLFRDVSQQVIKEENLQKNSQEVGTYMLLKFAELRDEFDIVGDVRGKGLMMGIEMVQDKVMICS